MKEKREDLEAERQKELLQKIVTELSRSHLDFYYKSTIEVAYLIKNYIKKEAKLTKDERDLLEPLSQHDIQLRLSLN